MANKEDEFSIGWELNGYRAWFEQDDATGYLYLADQNKVLYDLHIYNRSAEFTVAEEDVKVIWSSNTERCGVFIFGKLRGVIGMNGDMCRPAHTMVGEGITDPKWLAGFESKY